LFASQILFTQPSAVLAGQTCRAMPLLADTIASMCNASITEGGFPNVLEHAIIQPRLKKPTLSPEFDYKKLLEVLGLLFRIMGPELDWFDSYLVDYIVIPARCAAIRALSSSLYGATRFGYRAQGVYLLIMKTWMSLLAVTI